MSDMVTGARSRRRAPGELTPRQREVLALLAKRCTNGEIAERLGISLSAAKWHVSEIMGELGVDTREEAADWWREQNGLPARLRRGGLAVWGLFAVRPVAMGLATLALIAAVAVATALLWQGGDDETVPAVVDETPTVSPSSTVSAATPTASTTPDPFLAYETYPVPGRNELFAYTVFVEEERDADRTWTVRAVVVQDLATGQLVGHWRYSGTALGGPVNVVLAGDRVIVATHLSVTRYNMDGSDPFVLYEQTGDERIVDVKASPDATTVAVTTVYEGGGLVFINIDDGSEIGSVESAVLNADGFIGYAWQVQYRSDGTGVVVAGGTESERPGGRATVYLDGSFVVHPPEPEGYGAVSPSGTLYAQSFGTLGPCFHTAKESLRIYDFDARTDIFQLTPRDAAISPFEWSPDNLQLLYQTWSLVPGEECAWIESQPEMFLLDVTAGQVSKMDDVGGLQQAWYGDELVEAGCADERYDWPVRDRYGNFLVSCLGVGPGIAVGDLFVGGERIATWPNQGSPGLYQDIQRVGFLK
jgi:DNA-binding CsgD family transcriptional regulator